MENLKTTSFSSSSSSLPPGSRFYPSEEQLLCYYLSSKNSNNQNPNFRDPYPIKEISFYNYNPFELPEFTCFQFGYGGRKRHWYCFTESVNGGGGEEGGRRRRAGVGFWKMKGRVRDVMGNGGRVILGRRKCFIFYFRKSNGKNAVRTDWFMYEYAMIDNVKDSFVVCRVFVKSRSRNSISEHALSSCAEESLATVRHIGIQHDGSTMSALNEENALGCNFIQKVAGHPAQLIEERQPNNLVKSPVHAGSTDVNSLTAWHFASILQGDYLELDDLVG